MVLSGMELTPVAAQSWLPAPDGEYCSTFARSVNGVKCKIQEPRRMLDGDCFTSFAMTIDC